MSDNPGSSEGDSSASDSAGLPGKPVADTHAPAGTGPETSGSSHRPAARGLTAVMCLCVTLVVGMVSAVNLSIPGLSADPMHPSAQAVLWVVDGYVVVFACLLIPAGALADRRGRKGILLCGLGLFTAGNALCAAAPQVGALIAGRMLSGVGAAAVLPTTLALLVQAVPEERRQRAIAVWASMTGLAAVLGNVGGGAAIQYGTWRTLFVCMTPLALCALLLVALAAPAVPRHPRRVAPLGTVLLTGGFLALLYAVVSGPQEGWTSPVVLVGFLLSALLLYAWARHELRSEQPLLDPRLFLLPRLRAGALGMALLFTGMFGLFLLNGQYLQYAQGYGPLGAGIRLLPMAAALLAGPRCGVLLERLLGRRTAVATGMLVLAAGLGTVSTVTAHSPYPLYALGAVLTALGCGIATPLCSDAMMSALPPERAGVGSGLQSLARELGSAIGVAVTGSILTAVFTSHLPRSLRGPEAPTTVAAARAQRPDLNGHIVTAFTDALHTATLVLAAGIAVAALPVALWIGAGAAGRQGQPPAAGK